MVVLERRVREKGQRMGGLERRDGRSSGAKQGAPPQASSNPPSPSLVALQPGEEGPGMGVL